jgi:hypothetical protein
MGRKSHPSYPVGTVNEYGYFDVGRGSIAVTLTKA